MSPAAVRILQVPDCPLVDRLAGLVAECMDVSGSAHEVEHVVGDYPSPTLVVGGRDVATGLPVGTTACCRLDMPSRAQVLEALRGVDGA
ncbi:MAG: alkylmercury lyase [Segniliparus sp.]|uniref:alkylmercury lyase n=1 Tax=Segniliparus sp. TaxID=2804064 RepID=UPI003F3B2072